MSRRGQWQQAYAVVRVDHFPNLTLTPPEDDGPGVRSGEYDITVKEVVLTIEAARAEVKRLNALNEAKGCRYYWQGTHYFPDGGSFGSGGGNL